MHLICLMSSSSVRRSFSEVDWFASTSKLFSVPCLMMPHHYLHIIVIRFLRGPSSSTTEVPFSSSSFFSRKRSRAHRFRIHDSSRNSRSAGMGSQSTILLRQYNEKFRTTMGINGRMTRALKAVRLERIY